jgi:transposase InsO family protein
MELHKNASTCKKLDLRHLRTRPDRPRTNGKAERFIQTLLRGWAFAPIPPPLNARSGSATSFPSTITGDPMLRLADTPQLTSSGSNVPRNNS